MRAHHPDQAQVHAQVATGQCKRVHRTVAPEQDAPGKPLLQFGRQLSSVCSRADQGGPQELDVLVEHGVFQEIGVAVQFAGDAVAQLALGAEGDAFAIAQAGQTRQLGLHG